MICDVENGRLILAHDREISFQIRHSGRARRMRMCLSAEGGLTLTLPYGVSHCDAEMFVRSNIAWIERNLLKLSLKSRRSDCQVPVFPTEFVFPVTAEHFRICYEWKNVCWVGVRENGEILSVAGNVLIPERVHDALQQYLIRKAETVFEPMLRRLSEEYNFRIGNLSVRFQRGRWGSCSRGRDISLNAQMLFLSLEEVRYVLFHELCHTREMNHSERFWNEVRRCCPNYVGIRKSLNRHSLRLWG